MSWVFRLGFILFVTLWVSWTWVAISFPILGKFSTIILLKYFLMAFLFVFFFWDSYDSNVGEFNIVPEVLRLSSFLLIHVSFSTLFHLFPPFYLPPHLSYLLPQLFYCWFPSECFDLSYCIIHY